MKKVFPIPLFALVLIVAVLAAGSVIFAASYSQSIKTIRRTVESIDLNGRRIFLKPTKSRRNQIVITSTTMLVVVNRDGSRLASLSEFQRGDTIRAYIRHYPDANQPYAYLGLLVVKVAQQTSQSGILSRGRSTPPPEAREPYVPTGVAGTSSVVSPSPVLAFINPVCSQPLPAATGGTVTVGTVSELRNALNQANAAGNLTVLIRDGTYDMDNGLWITGNNVTFRSLSGNRDKVVLRGSGTNGGVTHIFWIEGKNATVADMTIGWVKYHPIQVMGEKDADNVRIRNVRIADSGEQLFKVSFDPARREIQPENGIVECSLLEFTTAYGSQWYIGGIDAHNAKNWVVRDNVFRNIKAPPSGYAASGPTEHAIHFWGNSENTLVERNVIINSDRGIGFGLGETAGHIGGIIRNNMIYHDSSQGDVGIGLETATGTQVLNNTIFFEHNYANAIEYRFGGTTGVSISRNITNKSITSRQNGTATLDNNSTAAERNWFRDPSAGDLRLSNMAPSSAYGKGASW